MNNFIDIVNPETRSLSPSCGMYENGSHKPVTDPACVRRFIQLFNDHAAAACAGIDNPGYLQLSCQQRDGKFTSQRFKIGDVNGMTDIAVTWSESGLGNVYIEGRTIRSDAPPVSKGRGTKEHTGVVLAVVIDNDPDKLMGASLMIEPTARTETSPGNSHDWYFLAKAVSAKTGDDLGHMLKTAVGTSDFDTGVTTQPYRVAGTIHYVNAEKRARGRENCATRILSLGRAYDVEEFRQALYAAGGSVKKQPSIPKAEISSTDKIAEELLNRCGIYRDFISQALATKKHNDRSVGSHALVARLKSLGFTVAEIVVLFEVFPESCWNEKWKGRLSAEIQRSWDKIDTDAHTTFPSEETCVTIVSREPKLPVINVTGGGLAKEADEAEAALIYAEANIYQRGGELVRPYSVEAASFKGAVVKSASLGRITEAAIIDNLCQFSEFVRIDARSGELRKINPPQNVAKTILARQDRWGFRAIAGVVSAPIIRPDGSIVFTEGYDPQTRLYLTNLPPMPEIPINPTYDDALKALDKILSLIEEFPFVDEPSRSTALSAFISPVCRSVMQTTPMHVSTAPTPGTGKSFLFDCVSLVATGNKCPVTALAKSVDENEKRIDGSLLDGAPIICLDNVNGELCGDKLCQAIERPIIEVRRLGASDKQKIENRATIFATGNNITITGDLTRRAIIVNLDAALERPEARQFKARPDLLILANRGEYLAACLIIVRAYILAGKPNLLPHLASFEDWSDTVRSALVWLGRADPVETMKAVQEDDPEHQERDLVFSSLFQAFGHRAVFVKEIIAATQETIVKDPENDFGHIYSERELRYPDLNEALMNIAGKHGEVDVEILGKWLRGNKGRIASGFQLIGIMSAKRAKWAIKAISTAVSCQGGDGGG